MKKEHRLHIWEIALLLGLLAGLLTGIWAQKTQSEIASELVRLHVLAKDDTAQEQAVKLAVRDEILRYLQPVLADAETAEEAQTVLRAHMEDIRTAALTAAGERQVAVTLTEEFYPTREYDGFSLPAGEYTSLRVILADGAGQNWWCVVYPPLCMASATETAALETLSEETGNIITEQEGYVYKFKILELFGEWKEKLQ